MIVEVKDEGAFWKFSIKNKNNEILKKGIVPKIDLSRLQMSKEDYICPNRLIIKSKTI